MLRIKSCVYCMLQFQERLLLSKWSKLINVKRITLKPEYPPALWLSNSDLYALSKRGLSWLMLSIRVEHLRTWQHIKAKLCCLLNSVLTVKCNDLLENLSVYISKNMLMSSKGAYVYLKIKNLFLFVNYFNISRHLISCLLMMPTASRLSGHLSTHLNPERHCL